MAVTAVVGLQWGDEAKGKIVDLLTDQHEIVVRYLGGNNAGHTVVCNGQTYKLSLLPSGILRDSVVSVIATGVVINPKALLEELDSLSRQGVEPGRLLISDRAHVIFPYHLAEEAALERRRGEKAIGTTMRGIGTCYRDKAGRTHAIRMGDMMRPELFRERLEDVVAQKNDILRALVPDHEPLQAAAIYDEYMQYAERLRPMVTDTTAFLHHALKQNSSMLFEAAQGSLLDIDHGTFPYVTSSNSSGCGIHPGSGVPERVIEKMIGVVKAYTTRVGGGPCPTELEDETGQHIRDEGNEYGTVTGRPRRCGWFDAVATGYGARISGVDCLAVMLLDVLSKLDELKICEAYEIDGERTTDFPSHIDELARAKPVYRTLPGWKKDITGVRKLSDLPSEARAYIDCVGELVGAPVEIVSVGPDREQTVRG
ncbi:MAG: adenylosuccinate synthase [Maioricimonas sp. JB045]|uniref:adenylosuccinate synthase n=1 Tax=Maioricimonas sp. JC845 TaxID=3232138 RepID=UPI0034597E43